MIIIKALIVNMNESKDVRCLRYGNVGRMNLEQNIEPLAEMDKFE